MDKMYGVVDLCMTSIRYKKMHVEIDKKVALSYRETFFFRY